MIGQDYPVSYVLNEYSALTLLPRQPYTLWVVEYAIFKTGGKQYRAALGDVIDVEKLPVEPGSEIELDQVLALSKDGQVTYGQPILSGVKVIAHVQRQFRDKKIRVFKYKRKTRYRRMRGHRQPYTRLQIADIVQEEETDGS